MAAYAAHADMVARFTQATMDQLVPQTGVNPPAADNTRIDKVLADASAFMDTYIGNAYTLPLAISPAPTSLVECCCDIGYYRLYAGRPIQMSQDSRQRYEDALKFLYDLSQRRATLGVDAAVQASVDLPVSQVSGPTRSMRTGFNDSGFLDQFNTHWPR